MGDVPGSYDHLLDTVLPSSLPSKIYRVCTWGANQMQPLASWTLEVDATFAFREEAGAPPLPSPTVNFVEIMFDSFNKANLY